MTIPLITTPPSVADLVSIYNQLVRMINALGGGGGSGTVTTDGALTVAAIPRATAAAEIGDGSLTDDGAGALGAANGINLTLTGFTAGTSGYGGTIDIKGGSGVYSGVVTVTGGDGVGTASYGGALNLRGGAGSLEGGGINMAGGGGGTVGGAIVLTAGTPTGDVLIQAPNGTAILNSGTSSVSLSIGGTARVQVDDNGNTNVINGILSVHSPVAVSSLPTPVAGMIATVNTATAPAIGDPVVGGGAATCVVCYGGSQWTVISI